uniref:Uncharacterized protein n=1 Tax=Aplanochytrium stocchinoi TaxID=215587 RepID=A0A7S3PSI3_9STRA
MEEKNKQLSIEHSMGGSRHEPGTVSPSRAPEGLDLPQPVPLGPRSSSRGFGYITSLASSWRTRLSLSSILTTTLPSAPKPRFPSRPKDYKSYDKGMDKRNRKL